MKTKKWYESKTLWLNVAAILVIVLDTFKDIVPLSQEQMGILLAVLNILNRFRSDIRSKF